MTDRTFSIRTGLAASTVTPGNTPPDASLTTPVIAACANTADGRSRSTNRMIDACLAKPDDITSLPPYSVVKHGTQLQNVTMAAPWPRYDCTSTDVAITRLAYPIY